MTAQLNFLNGEDRKLAGMLAVEVNNPSFLSIMRTHAKEVSTRKGEVCIDDVREFAEQEGLTPPNSHVWGCVFTQRGWVRVGESPSRIKTNHAHRNKVWKWVGEG